MSIRFFFIVASTFAGFVMANFNLRQATVRSEFSAGKAIGTRANVSTSLCPFHEYSPPADFIDAVLSPVAQGTEWQRYARMRRTANAAE